MDAVVGSLQSSKAIYAASKVAHFDRIKTEGRMIHLFSLNTIALGISAFAHYYSSWMHNMVVVGHWGFFFGGGVNWCPQYCTCARLVILTGACVSLVPMRVPKTTSETLKHKINPSLELAAPQAVDVLLYTPGTHIYVFMS